MHLRTILCECAQSVADKRVFVSENIQGAERLNKALLFITGSYSVAKNRITLKLSFNAVVPISGLQYFEGF